MSNPKPIAVVYLYRGHNTNDDLFSLQRALDARWTDYHVFVVPVDDQERNVELEVFYDKDFTDTNYEDLKKWITDYIKPSPPTENKP